MDTRDKPRNLSTDLFKAIRRPKVVFLEENDYALLRVGDERFGWRVSVLRDEGESEK